MIKWNKCWLLKQVMIKIKFFIFPVLFILAIGLISASFAQTTPKCYTLVPCACQGCGIEVTPSQMRVTFSGVQTCPSMSSCSGLAPVINQQHDLTISSDPAGCVWWKMIWYDCGTSINVDDVQLCFRLTYDKINGIWRTVVGWCGFMSDFYRNHQAASCISTTGPAPNNYSAVASCGQQVDDAGLPYRVVGYSGTATITPGTASATSTNPRCPGGSAINVKDANNTISSFGPDDVIYANIKTAVPREGCFMFKPATCAGSEPEVLVMEACDDCTKCRQSDCQPVPIGKVKLYLNNDYIIETKEQRLFDPRGDGYDPFEDYDCTIQVPKSTSIESTTFQGRLLTRSDETINNGTLIYNRLMSLNDPDYNYYTWTIRGWDNGAVPGIAPADKLETLIASRTWRQIKCGVKLTSSTTIYSSLLQMERCTNLWGPEDAEFSIVTVRTSGVGWSPTQVVQRAVSNYVNGYHQIDPFKTYKLKFKQKVDLENYDDRLIASFVLSDITNCKGGTLHNIYVQGSGIAERGGISSKDSPFALLGPLSTIDTVLHETGHAFCGLNDEYVYPLAAAPPNLEDKIRDDPKNCDYPASRPEIGPFLRFLPYGSAYPGCVHSHFFRTSSESIMKGLTGEDRFNVWSCAFCVYRILHGSGTTIRTYAETCKGLDCINETPDPGDYNIECIFGNPFYCLDTKGWDIECVKDCDTSHRCVMETDCEKDGKSGTCDTSGKCIIQ